MGMVWLVAVKLHMLCSILILGYIQKNSRGKFSGMSHWGDGSTSGRDNHSF